MEIKVLHLVENLNTGGLERVVKTIASGLDPRKYNVQVWCIVSGGDIAQEIRNNGIKTEVLNIRTYYNPFNILKLAYLIKKFKPDIVHTHGYFPSVIGRVAAKMAGVPTIINHLHTLFYSLNLRNVIIDKFLNLFTDRIICVSEKVKGSFINAGYKIKTKATVIYNGVDETVFKPASLNGEIKNLISIGSLYSHKRHVDILKALKIVLQTHPEINLQIVGDGPLRENLQEVSKKLGIFSNVQFLGFRKDIPSLLARSHIFIHPSSREGFPLALVEAMACALPIIASEAGGILEVVKNGENGLTFPTGDYKLLSVAIETLLKDPQKARQMGLKAREIFETEFTSKIMLQRLDALYIELLTKGA